MPPARDPNGGSGAPKQTPTRIDTVYRCVYCHTETNLQEPVGMYGNPRVRCPVCRDAPSGSSGAGDPKRFEPKHRRHAALQRLLDRRETLDDRLHLYSPASGHAAVIAKFEAERDLVEDRIAALRTWFDGRFDDIVDADPTTDPQLLTGSHAEVSDTALERSQK